MFPRNENRNEGTFGCSTGTRTRTRVRSHVPPEREPERGHVRMFPRNENRNEGTFAKTTLLRNALLSPGDSSFPRGPCDRKNSIPIENFNPGLKFSISIENFNLDRKFQSRGVSIHGGASWCYRKGLYRKFQSTIDRSKYSIPKAAIEFFQSPGPLGPFSSQCYCPHRNDYNLNS